MMMTFATLKPFLLSSLFVINSFLCHKRNRAFFWNLLHEKISPEKIKDIFARIHQQVDSKILNRIHCFSAEYFSFICLQNIGKVTWCSSYLFWSIASAFLGKLKPKNEHLFQIFIIESWPHDGIKYSQSELRHQKALPYKLMAKDW